MAEVSGLMWEYRTSLQGDWTFSIRENLSLFSQYSAVDEQMISLMGEWKAYFICGAQAAQIYWYNQGERIPPLFKTAWLHSPGKTLEECVKEPRKSQDHSVHYVSSDVEFHALSTKVAHMSIFSEQTRESIRFLFDKVNRYREEKKETGEKIEAVLRSGEDIFIGYNDEVKSFLISIPYMIYFAQNPEKLTSSFLGGIRCALPEEVFFIAGIEEASHYVFYNSNNSLRKII